MAVVYEAVHAELGRRVAIKVVTEAITENPIGLARFTREAKVLAKLRHPNIVAATELAVWEGRAYFVMDLLEGPTLAAHLRARAGEPLAVAEVVRIFLPIVAAVAAAHASGVVHRDLKPSNVLLARRGGQVEPTVLDFGISTSEDFDEEQTLTRTGAVLGTVSYLSPEQTRGAKYASVQSDQYALGVMLYECATGELPFRGEGAYETMHAIVTHDIRRPSALREGLSGAFEEVVLRAMHRDPRRRYASVAELGRALLQLADEREKARWRAELENTHNASSAVANQPEDETLTEEPARREPRRVSSDVTPGAAARSRRVGQWALAASVLLVFAAGGGAVALFSRGMPERHWEPSIGSEEKTLLALTGPDARLACPIFEVRGVRDVAVRLGAAAATLACARASWNLGGRDDRVLPPAALLDVPRQPVDAFPDPYVTPEQRAQTVDRARTRATAYLDGVVTYGHDWLVELVLRTRDDHEIERVQARDATFFPAMKKALDLSWAHPLARQSIDPEVSRWTSLDYDLGVTLTNNELLNSPDGCDAMRRRASTLGNAFFPLERQCELSGSDATVDAGVPTLDESSPQALVATAHAAFWTESPPAEAQRLAERLDTTRESEASTFGRSRISLGAAELWHLASAPERAQASVLLSLREDPFDVEAWHLLVTWAASTGSAAPAAAIASLWFPNDERFITQASSYRGDELEARLRDAGLAYILEPRLETAMHLGRALAEAGRADEVRALAATPLDDPAQNRILEPYLLAFVDLHDAKIGRAITRLESAGNIAMLELAVIAEVAGRGEEVATRWAARFLSLPDEAATVTASGYDAPMVLCMRASGGLAGPCLDRVAHLGRTGVNWWGDGGEALLAGARRYARGDISGAVSAWRSLVAGPNLQPARLLPTEAFEHAGEHDLAARLDARKMPYTFISGVSDATPREAERAMHSGDKARAKTLAQRVIAAWEVADLKMPAVERMRVLLTSLGP
jgi:hypothetical protein